MAEFLLWLNVITVPALAGLFWLTQHQRERLEIEIIKNQCEARAAIAATRTALADYKLHVSQHYASKKVVP